MICSLSFLMTKKQGIMADERKEQNKQGKGNQETDIKPDQETLNTTDPQEHMEGPLSSLMQSAGDSFDSKNPVNKEDEKKQS